MPARPVGGGPARRPRRGRRRRPDQQAGFLVCFAQRGAGEDKGIGTGGFVRSRPAQAGNCQGARVEAAEGRRSAGSDHTAGERRRRLGMKSRRALLGAAGPPDARYRYRRCRGSGDQPGGVARPNDRLRPRPRSRQFIGRQGRCPGDGSWPAVFPRPWQCGPRGAGVEARVLESGVAGQPRCPARARPVTFRGTVRAQRASKLGIVWAEVHPLSAADEGPVDQAAAGPRRCAGGSITSSTLGDRRRWCRCPGPPAPVQGRSPTVRGSGPKSGSARRSLGRRSTVCTVPLPKLLLPITTARPASCKAAATISEAEARAAVDQHHDRQAVGHDRRHPRRRTY